MASGSGRRRLRAGSNALQIAVRLVEVHGVAAADCGCQLISSLQRRRTELASWKSLGWQARARFTVRPGHGPGTLRGSKGLSGVSLENEVGDEAPSTTLKSDLAPASPNCNPTARRHARRLQRRACFMLMGWLDAAMGVGGMNNRDSECNSPIPAPPTFTVTVVYVDAMERRS